MTFGQAARVLQVDEGVVERQSGPARTLEDRAGHAPEQSGDAAWTVQTDPERVPMLLAGLVTGTGNQQIDGFEVLPDTAGFRLSLRVRALPSASLAQLSLAKAKALKPQ